MRCDKIKKRVLKFCLLGVFIIFAVLTNISFIQAQTEAKQATLMEMVTSGGRVTMEFEDADIADVIKVIAYASGMNMVIGKDVQAKVTMSLKDVPWERALDVVLKTYNFTYKREDNLIRVMTFEQVKQEERDIPLETAIIYLNFVDADNLRETLANTLSSRGTIAVDNRTNSMVVTDTPDNLVKVREISKSLDTPTPQVMIEAMLVDVKLTEDEELGINWNITKLDRANPADYTDTGVYRQYQFQQPSGTMNPLTSQSITLGLIDQMGAIDFEATISAWVRDGKAVILASPKILTVDNETATIDLIQQIPYTESVTSTEGGATAGTAFKDVGTRLNVTPHITADGHVSMHLKPEQSFASSYSGGIPVVDKRTANTTVLVKDGQTVVIGGLRKREDTRIINKVPFLGDIPILGHLFRHKDYQTITTELLMFVTPHIVVKPQLTQEEIDRYKILDKEIAEDIQRLERDISELKLFKKEKKKKPQIISKAAELEVEPVKEEPKKLIEEVLPAAEAAAVDFELKRRETDLPQLKLEDTPKTEPLNSGRDWIDEGDFVEERLDEEPGLGNRGYIYKKVIPENIR